MSEFQIEDYDLSKANWVGGSQGKMATLLQLKEYPKRLLDPILYAVRKGATFAQAAAAGGFTPGELEFLIRNGTEGHPAFEEFRDNLLQADYESVGMVMGKLREKAEEGDLRATRQYLNMKSKEFRVLHGTDPSSVKANQAALPGGVNIQINTGFGDPPALEDGNTIDADGVEEIVESEVGRIPELEE